MPVLRFAFVAFPSAQILDLTGPLDVLGYALSTMHKDLPVAIESKIVASSLDAVALTGGLRILPDLTFDQAQGEHWDALVVPGGFGVRPWLDSNRPAVDFLKRMVPRVTYVLTVCTGSWLLSRTGHLAAQRATTNKSAFNLVKEHTAEYKVDWVPKARWVVSGKFWTSSGVTAGQDMASAFVRYLLAEYTSADEAKRLGDQLLGILEVTEAQREDDPWAEFYKLG